MNLRFMSLGETHGMSPPQYPASSFVGVPPLNAVLIRHILAASQCAGISPSHSTPESFMGTFGSRPFGDGAGDERGALLLQQRDQPLFLRHQRINLRRLPVEKVCDGFLLWDSGKGIANRNSIRS